MKKRIVLLTTLTVLVAASVHAQTKDFAALVRYGTPQEVQQAIESGADVNAVSSSWKMAPLALAASYNGNAAVIQVLLKAGANTAPDEYGGTALMSAAWSNTNAEVIKALLEAGIDVNSANKSYHGRTALMFAAEHGRSPEVVLALLEGGADARAEDSDGKTALDLAQHNYALRRTEALAQLEKASRD
jgi:uncharacterized protein